MSSPEVTTKIETFFAQFSKFTAHSEEILVHADQKSPFVYLLTKGVVQQVAWSPDGHRTIITLYKPGSFFPLMGALQGRATSFDFEVLSLAEGWKAPLAEVEQFLKTNPDVSYDLNVRLLAALEGMSRKVQQAMKGEAGPRLVDVLVMLAHRFGTPQESGEVALNLKVTHHYLAELSGLSRETVSRELKKLKQIGLLAGRGSQYRIPNLKSLEMRMFGL